MLSRLRHVRDGLAGDEAAQQALFRLVLGHCVFSYTAQCLAGAVSIWSIRVLNPEEEGLEKHVLTIAVDNRKRAVTQARGKFNMSLNQKARPEKQRRAGSRYVHLLRESGRVMRLWMDKAGWQ